MADIGMEEEKNCPVCAETIKKAAVLCRYCKSEIPEENGANREQSIHGPKISQQRLSVAEKEQSAKNKVVPFARHVVKNKVTLFAVLIGGYVLIVGNIDRFRHGDCSVLVLGFSFIYGIGTFFLMRGR